MCINLKSKIMVEYWWDRNTKCFQILNMKKAWKENGNPRRFCIGNNGGRRSKGDKYFDFHIHLGYIIIHYRNFDLQGRRKHLNNENR